MARPSTYSDDAVVTLSAKEAKSKLHEGSERRAIVNLLVSRKGRLTLKQINAHFGYDIRKKVIALVRSGWLELEDEE